jgi:hypothetical protein
VVAASPQNFLFLKAMLLTCRKIQHPCVLTLPPLPTEKSL